MLIKERADVLLKYVGNMSNDEKVFQFLLKNYQIGQINRESIQKKVLTEKEELFKFKTASSRFGTVNITNNDINYYLEKNFIINYYLMPLHEYNNELMKHLNYHYNLLLTRNFEDIELSLQTNLALKPYLANEYIKTIYSNKNKVTELIEKHPEKVEEVSALLLDYQNYHNNGLVRPIETITKENIKKPYVLTKKVSV